MRSSDETIFDRDNNKAGLKRNRIKKVFRLGIFFLLPFNRR
jgi:hypothetical protein